MSTDVCSAVAASSGTLVSGRNRLKGVVITTNGVAGSVVFKDGGAFGTTMLTINTPGATGINDVFIPADGILFSTDIYVALSNVSSVTAFYG
jgi:hypothetical protein